MTQTLDREAGRRPLAYGRKAWIPLLLDVMAVAWMTSAGGWFDRHGLLSVITLGGHHDVVTVLAVASFAILTGLAVSTEGFARASAPELGLLTVAVLCTVVALAGLLSLVALVLGVGVFVGLLVKLTVR